MPFMSRSLDVITVGSALRDTMFYTKHAHVIDNPVHDPTCRRILGVEYGAKIQSDNVFQGFGGGASNTATNFAGLGLRTGIVASVGKDRDGDMMLAHLTSLKVNTSLIHVDKKLQTGFSFLLINENSGEHSALVHYGAAKQIQVSETTLARAKTKWFYVASLNGSNWKTVLKHISQHPASLAWNPGGTQLSAGFRGLKRFFGRTNVLILNRDEATELVMSHPHAPKKAPSVKQLLKLIHAWGPGVVLITEGPRGAHAFDGQQYFYQESPSHTPRDTTGAGDCYGSSFVTGLIRYDGDIRRSLQLAQHNAASLVKKVGAQSGLLKWKDLPASFRR